MPKLHPDSAAIDRVGLPAIRAHFEISRQSAHYWRQTGVPKQHRKSLALLGESLGHDMSEMRQMRDRIYASPPTSGGQPTSSPVAA